MTIKVFSVVGARPQFIKAAMLTHAIEDNSAFEQILVHTGQHYDYGMSEVFFEELSIPKPNVNLGISGGTHAEMTGKMMIALEREMKKSHPDCVLVYGDTNSTLAAALAAAKLCLPVVHAEAGARTHFLTNPEEINRKCTDHVSTLLFAPIPSAVAELEREGLGDRCIFTGDLMYDAYLMYSDIAKSLIINLLGLDCSPVSLPKNYVYLTCHRQENSSYEVLKEILLAMEALSMQVVYPVHPRVSSMVSRIKEDLHLKNTILVQPVGYLESLALLNGADKVVTDSGGLQREAFFAKRKCITLLPFAGADETLTGGRNTLVPVISYQAILDAFSVSQEIDSVYLPFGDGQAARKMRNAILETFGGR